LVVLVLVACGGFEGNARGALGALAAMGLGGALSLFLLWPWMGAALDETNPALQAAGASRHWIGLLATCGLALLLAVLGTLPALRERRIEVALIAASSVVLAAMALGLQAAEDCEYKFLRMLILPLGILSAGALSIWWRSSSLRRLGIVLALALLFPTNAIALKAVYAFARGDVLFERDAAGFVRKPADSPLSAVYQWIRERTPRDAIVIDDPFLYPNNIAGALHHNEVPIFTRRALFADEKYYLTDRYQDLGQRHAICRRLFHQDGRVDGEQIELLLAFDRPIYLLLRGRISQDEQGRMIFEGYAPELPPALESQGIFQLVHRVGPILLYQLKGIRR
jgi:hypothetical protein